MADWLDELRAEKLRAAIKRFVGRRVRDAASVEDITQDVLLKISRGLDSVKRAERIEAWALRIAGNRVADYFRAARPTEHFQEEAHSAQVVSTQEASELNEDTFLRSQINAYIRAVIEGLPPIHKEALLLTEYEGLSQVALARRLGLSVSGAKSRVQRARAAVKEEIERCCRWSKDRYGSVIDVQPKTSGDCNRC